MGSLFLRAYERSERIYAAMQARGFEGEFREVKPQSRIVQTFGWDGMPGHAVVDTAEFQAPGFYERLGYAVVGRIEDCDGHGHAKYYLTRTIA